MAEFTPHPKPPPKAKKPGAMRTKPKMPKVGRRVQPVVAAEKTAPTPRKSATLGASVPASKTDLILAMLRAPGGATSKALEAATGWQPHSVRGLLGSLRKKGVPVTSDKQPKQATVYSIPENGVGDVV